MIRRKHLKQKRGGGGKNKCLTACPHTFFQGKKSETSRLPHFRKVTLGEKKKKKEQISPGNTNDRNTALMDYKQRSMIM